MLKRRNVLVYGEAGGGGSNPKRDSVFPPRCSLSAVLRSEGQLLSWKFMLV